MASSGTTAREFQIDEIIEEAYELAGIELRTGYQLRSAIRSIDLLMLEWSNRGYNLWTIDEETFSTVAGTASYTTAAGTVDVIQCLIRIDTTDYILSKTSSYEHMARSQKSMQGRPTVFWLKREVALPVIYFWQVPDRAYTVVYWRMRRIEDAGDASNTLDIPARFTPALISGLALRLAAKSPKPESASRVPLLKADYDEQWNLATGEDREKSHIYIRAGGRR